MIADSLAVLGLDLSLTSTGWAVHGRHGVATGRLASTQRGCERLHWIACKVLAAAQRVDLVALEGYAFARPNQAHQVGELGGVVRLELWRAGIPWVAVPPATVKKYATGKGTADKTAMVIAARERLGYSGQQPDEADAMWVYAAAMAAAGQPIVQLPKDHVAALTATGTGKRKHPPLTEQVAAALGDRREVPA